MRVLFITGEFPPMQGGVGDCTNEIAKEIVSLGVDVLVLTSTKAKDRRSSRGAVVRPIIDHWGWSSLRVIANVCREYAPDIVHIQYQTGAYGMHPAINFLPRVLTPRSMHPERSASGVEGQTRGVEKNRVRLVVTFHDLRVPYLFPKAGPVREWVTRMFAQSCDAVIATNDEDYLKLETWDLRPALIPIGSNITPMPPANYDRAAWRAKLGVDADETLLGYFGFLNDSKGGETLMRALALMPNAKLLMIGGQTGASDPTNVAYLAQVKALIDERGLTHRIIWTDHVAPAIVTAHFYASDICVMPYRDGASYRRGTLMAALAHGCAIVTTANSRQSTVDSRQLPQLRDNENCLLVPPDDPPAIADAVRKLIAAPELRAKIGAGARALAQHFTWNQIARQHLELYERMRNE